LALEGTLSGLITVLASPICLKQHAKKTFSYNIPTCGFCKLTTSMWVIISGFGTQAQEVKVYVTIPQAKTQLRGVEDARSIVGTKKC